MPASGLKAIQDPLGKAGGVELSLSISQQNHSPRRKAGFLLDSGIDRASADDPHCHLRLAIYNLLLRHTSCAFLRGHIGIAVFM